MGGVKVLGGAAAAALFLVQMAMTPARADTMEAALLRAYRNNPQLNAQPASVRSIDENVPQALAGYRPKVAATASSGIQYTDTGFFSEGARQDAAGPQIPRAFGATATQTLFNRDQ